MPLRSTDRQSTATLDGYLSGDAIAQVQRVLHKFTRRGLCDFDLTGGLAVGMHRSLHNASGPPRALNDIDVVVDGFRDVPEILARDFLVLHVHPSAPSGKIVVQLADAEEAVRVDVISTRGATRMRSRLMDTALGTLRIVSVEDLAARAVAVLMDLARGKSAPSKFAELYFWLSPLMNAEKSESAWHDHRGDGDPPTFGEAHAIVRELVESRRELLVVPEYSRDLDANCPKCVETGVWRLSPKRQILSVLGYV